MKRTLLLAGMILAVAASVGCRRSRVSAPSVGDDHVILIEKDDAEMNAAKAHARAETDAFLAKMRVGEAQDLSVKVPV